MGIKENKVCFSCGRPLNESNAWIMPEKFGSGPTFFCINCQQSYFEYLSKLVGNKLTLFYCCVMFNVPYIPEMITASEKYAQERGRWKSYINTLCDNGYRNRAGRWHGFSDGMTNIKLAFPGYADMQTGVNDVVEKPSRGREDWVKDWGKGPEEEPYSTEEYMEMDRTMDALLASRPGHNEQQELSMEKIAKWTVMQERCSMSGDVTKAKAYQDMIAKEMESAQLRKKDEVPQDTVQLDDIVMALERAGLPIMDYDELCDVLAQHALHTTFPYTRDAADQMILMIRNTTAYNEGQSEWDTLPPEYSITDDLHEFADEPDETELKNYKSMGLNPMNNDKKR